MTQLQTIAPTLNISREFRNKLGIDGSTEVLQGRFAFSELIAWEHPLATQARALGLEAIDADEALNCVRVVVADDAKEAAILQAAAQAGMKLTRFRGRLTRPKFGAEVVHEGRSQNRSAA
jgi:hypothetical protein